MKKILMAAVALICMTMISVVLTACGTEEKSIIKSETVTYQLVYNNMEYATGHAEEFSAFSRDMTNAMESVGMIDISESDLIKRLQAVVDTYNNKYLRGNVVLQKSYNGSSNWTIVKTFTMTAAQSE